MADEFDAEREARRLLAVHQTAYANAHNRSGLGVIESDKIAMTVLAEELLKIYRAGRWNQWGTITTGTPDLTDHATDCELRGATAPICTAMAMDPNRKVMYTCTCGAWQDSAQAEIRLLRSVCAEAYQLAGVYDAPVKALDNLAAAASGKPLPHETFLPVDTSRHKEPLFQMTATAAMLMEAEEKYRQRALERHDALVAARARLAENEAAYGVFGPCSAEDCSACRIRRERTAYLGVEVERLESEQIANLTLTGEKEKLI